MIKSKKIQEDAISLYEGGLSIEDVSEKLGVCYRTARTAIRGGGVVLRDPSARLKGRTRPNNPRKKAS
jgi:hypothetical protein